jgi:hypothetical protein
MATPRYYVPTISRSLVRVLYHEGKHRHMPMTRLVDELLTTLLIDTPGWQIARQAEQQEMTTPPSQDQQVR